MPLTVLTREAVRLPHGVAKLALATVLALLAAPLWAPIAATPASAAQDLKLVCPKGGGDPVYRNRNNGNTVKITDPQHLALAEAMCGTEVAATATQTSTVKIVNNRNTAIYVAFTVGTGAGPITWGKGCTKTGSGAKIARGGTCSATIVNNNVSSRFCAALDGVPNCNNAQAKHLTMVETIYQPSTSGGCFNKGACVWFDISVIPSKCTDALWDKNQCANTGGASYNFPVSVACASKTVYTCRGPATTKYGPALYPSKCGNPYATTAGGGPNTQNAYFYPMFDPPENAYQPNTVCLGGQPLTIRFLSGS